MKHIYLIRHGLPDFPDGKRMCLGVTDIPLGPEGLAQAREMASRLPPVTAVYSSPLLRARQTAAAIGQDVTVIEDLREMDAGAWDGLTFEEIRLRYPELYAARGTNPNLLPPGAEDHAAGLRRFRAALEKIARECPGDAAVVAHGGVMGQLIQSLGAPWRKPDYAEILPLLWQDENLQLL